ncbi:MAG TPA: methenyltetrahydromethanopterin cyclohydrolase [Pirellulales bacterium]|nr:methenyltetrahydromethanopterin cyclohydrolase [Pirellulales bacterium]
MNLNSQAVSIAERIAARAQRLRANLAIDPSGATIIDLGINTLGSLEAGLLLAETCLAGLGQVTLAPADSAVWRGPAVCVFTDHPAAACMASQYAGWQLSEAKFFAMGSGPMRAAAGREAIFDRIGHRETAERVVGVLEARTLPPLGVIQQIAAACRVSPRDVTLLVAPTASIAGTIQIVARSVETALHKLTELGFDVGQIVSACGSAPLPPVAASDLAAIGRTNDAILYGAEVTLWLQGGDDAELIRVGAQVPSSASRDYGEPFEQIFERYHRKFYDIDPHLFSPAVVTLINLKSGRAHRFGRTRADVLAKSFGMSQAPDPS